MSGGTYSSSRRLFVRVGGALSGSIRIHVNGYTDDGARVHIVLGDVVLANGYGSGSFQGKG
jgi:hypothetical protein